MNPNIKLTTIKTIQENDIESFKKESLSSSQLEKIHKKENLGDGNLGIKEECIKVKDEVLKLIDSGEHPYKVIQDDDSIQRIFKTEKRLIGIRERKTGHFEGVVQQQVYDPMTQETNGFNLVDQSECKNVTAFLQDQRVAVVPHKSKRIVVHLNGRICEIIEQNANISEHYDGTVDYANCIAVANQYRSSLP